MSEQPSTFILNTFEAGQISDIDPTKTKNSSFVEGENIRIFDKSGHGLVITNISGNDYIANGTVADNVGFTLSEGFVPLGGCVYNGILFIASCKLLPVSNQSYHTGEIGCFPSLNAGVWERVYRPLQNFDDGSGAGDFTTDLLKFYPDKQIEMIPWEDIDGSIDLIFTDNTNPLRVINCGFDLDGTSNSRVYSAIHFPGAVSCVLGTKETMGITSQTIGNGGNLGFGNYFFFFRYADASFNTTNFVCESRPVQVYDGDLSVGGAQGALDGRSTKKVTFALSNLDLAFNYLQIGFIRFFSGEDGQVVYEHGLIDRDIPFDATTLTFDITGTESIRVITLDEIIANRQEDDIVRTITVAEKRLWGASWSGSLTYHESMLTFAQLVTIRVQDTLEIDAEPFQDLEETAITQGSATSMGQYKDPVKTAENAGYFRTEAYPFALRFELINGYLSMPVPIQGFDGWQYAHDSVSDTNTKGIFRFPGYDTHPIYRLDTTDKIKVLGVKIDMSAAITAVQAAVSTDTIYWMKENVRAVYVVRGERYKTIEYQGIAVNCAAPKTKEADTKDWSITQACSIGPNGSEGMDNGPGSNYELSNLQSANWDSGNGYLRQAYGLMSESAQITGRPFFGAEVSGADETDIDQTSYQDDVAIPIFRGYAPMQYLSSDTRTVDSIKRNKVRNYMSRWFCVREKIAVFSPDFMFSPVGDVSGIKMISSVGKTVPTPTQYAAGGLSSAYDLWAYNALNTGFAAYYPRWTMAEQTGGLTASTLTDSNITVGKVGEHAVNSPQSPVLQMCNKMKDFWSSDVETMFYASDDNDEQIWSNRSMINPKFIAVNRLVADTVDQNFNCDIVNLYNTTNPYALVIENLFPELSNVKYAMIGEGIELDWDTMVPADYDELVYYGGDCFVQRTYFKMQSWAGTSFNAEGWDHLFTYSEDVTDFHEGETGSFFTHGMILGIITENAINTAMRAIKDDHLYYPYVRSSESFAGRAGEDRSESFFINMGNSKTLSLRQSFGYDSRFPVIDKRKKVRIRFSDESQPGSYYNGFRVFREGNKKEFNLPDGEIMRLLEFNENIVSVQHRAINLHYINERQLANDPENMGLVMGKGEILADKVRALANFGSQHQWAIDVSGYGVDVNRRLIWSIYIDESTGYTKIKAGLLSEEKLCSKKLKEILDEWSPRGDILNTFGDAPINSEGVAVYLDPSTSEVYFVFTSKKESVPVNISDEDPINIPE